MDESECIPTKEINSIQLYHVDDFIDEKYLENPMRHYYNPYLRGQMEKIVHNSKPIFHSDSYFQFMSIQTYADIIIHNLHYDMKNGKLKRNLFLFDFNPHLEQGFLFCTYEVFLPNWEN